MDPATHGCNLFLARRVHRPAYDFNDAAIPAGCSYWAEVVERRMPAG